jgi:hypothetical protein
MFGKKDLDGLDEFKKAWDEAPERKAPAPAQAEDTGAVTNMDDFDYGDPVKDAAKAAEIKAEPVSTPELDNIASDDAKRAAQTTKEAIEPVKAPEMTFKQAFAAAHKAGKTAFDWGGKKIAVKLKSEMAKAKAAPVAVVAKPVSQPVVDSSEGESSTPSFNAAANAAARTSTKTQAVKAVSPPASPKIANITNAEPPVEMFNKTSSATKPKASDSGNRIAVNGHTVNSKNERVQVVPKAGGGIEAPEGGFKLMGKAA